MTLATHVRFVATALAMTALALSPLLAVAMVY